MPALALHSFSQAIEIPTSLRDQPLDAWPTSARLTTLLDRFGIRVLGDLHGRKVVDFAWEKNCGPKTLYELDLLARRARLRNGEACGVQREGRAHVSHNFIAPGDERTTVKMQEDAANFAIPESVCHLSFKELPITKRLANVVRSIGAGRLGDLNGRSAFELLQCKACGWRTISQIQQLIERAASGEFDVRQIEETDAAAELLRLLEQGLAKLPLRDRELVRARIGGQIRNGRSPGADLLYLSYAEIGRRHGLTRARVHKVFANTVDTLRKIWGPRIPRLLEIMKWRCLSTICPLTPQLLGRWIDLAATCSQQATTRNNLRSNFRLSNEAHVRLIAALDKGIPCWLQTNQKPRCMQDSFSQFDLALAYVVREGGGQLTIAEAYHQLTCWVGRDYRQLTIENFLRMLRSVECSIIEFKNPQSPTIRVNELNVGVLLGEGPTKDGKPLNGLKVHSNLSATQFFSTKNGSCERRAVAAR